MKQYPSHTHKFKAVRDTMEDYDMTMDDAGASILWLFFTGLILRLWTLGVLVLLKYSQGNSCVGRIVHLISKGLNRIGMPSVFAPKSGDTAEVVLQRKPSQRFKAEPAWNGP